MGEKPCTQKQKLYYNQGVAGKNAASSPSQTPELPSPLLKRINVHKPRSTPCFLILHKLTGHRETGCRSRCKRRAFARWYASVSLTVLITTALRSCSMSDGVRTHESRWEYSSMAGWTAASIFNPYGLSVIPSFLAEYQQNFAVRILGRGFVLRGPKCGVWSPKPRFERLTFALNPNPLKPPPQTKNIQKP